MSMTAGVTLGLLLQLLLLQLMLLPPPAHSAPLASAAPPIAKSVDMYLNNFPRVEDFTLGPNSAHWANSSSAISGVTRTFVGCCNTFELGADGIQEYTHAHNGSYATDSWGQGNYVAAGKRVLVSIGLRVNATVSASDICHAALARKEAYAAELIGIALHESLDGFNLDWEFATGNDVGCMNELWAYVTQQFGPHNLSMVVSIDDSNHQGPMDLNSTAPWSSEWDWEGFVAWTGTLIDMGTYPGSWSKGLSYPAAQHLKAVPCPAYPQKLCGLEGQVLDMLAHGVVAATGQLSPGLSPGRCSADGSTTAEGWTERALTSFLSFLDTQQVRTVTLWFSNALQTYPDSFTCPWFVPALVAWAQRA